MSHPQCLLCQAGQEIDLAKSNAEIARQTGVSKDSARRHRKHVTPGNDWFFGAIPESIITSRGRTVRLPDGSYEKVTYSPARKALLEAFTYDDVEKALEGYVATPRITTMEVREPSTLHVCAADLQVGKVDVYGGTNDLITRVMDSFHAAAERARRERPDEIVLWDLGDIIENFNNTNSQRETNDANLTTQIRTARRLLVEGIKLLLPLTNNLILASVPSNHCQVRTGIGDKMLAGTADNDFGLEINHQIEDVFEGRPEMDRLAFVRPGDYSEVVTLRLVDGTQVSAVHGHQARSQDKMGEWWKGQSHGRQDYLESTDILLHGHFHNLSVRQSGNGRWILGAPTSDNGSTWFTSRTGESSQNGMLVFTTKNGSWQNLEIL